MRRLRRSSRVRLSLMRRPTIAGQDSNLFRCDICDKIEILSQEHREFDVRDLTSRNRIVPLGGVGCVPGWLCVAQCPKSVAKCRTGEKFRAPPRLELAGCYKLLQSCNKLRRGKKFGI